MKEVNIPTLGIIIIFVVSLSLVIMACEKENFKPESNSFSFPIGRSFLYSSEVKVNIGKREYAPEIVADFSGGFWFIIPKEEVLKGEKVKIQFTRKREELVLFSEADDHGKNWIRPSYYIDSENEVIKNKATELSTGLTSHMDIAKNIQEFVVSHVRYNGEKKYSSFVQASQTFKEKEGTCMNLSRLFVALSRAANVPARSIWGVVYGDNHHQWAEFRDESGKWHPTEFNATWNFELNDTGYIDLIYGAEENDFLMHRDTTEIMFHNLKFFNDYPSAFGNLGFKTKTYALPDSMVVEYVYDPEKLIIP